MDKKTLLAFLLIAVIILLTPAYYNIIYPQAENEGVDSLQTKNIDTHLAVEQETPTAKTPQPPTNKTDNKHVFVENLITLETSLFNVVISSNNGGSIVSYSLKNYPYLNNGQVELINNHNKNNLLLGFRDLDGDSVVLSGFWESINKRKDYGYIDSPTTVRFKTIYNGKTIFKNLTFYPDQYTIDIYTDISSAQSNMSQGVYSLSWDGGLPITEKNTKDDLGYFNSYVYQGDELHSPDLSSEGSIKTDRVKGDTEWVAVRTKYFTSALIPKIRGLGGTTSGVQFENEEKVFNVSLLLSAENNLYTTLYLGPLEYEKIKALNVGLDSIMNFGWSFIRPISKGVLFVLTKLNDYIPNYGVILILFSIIIKILVYPLTKKSYESTQKMQAIQPQLNKLKEKYKNDQQKMSQAQMAMFKEHGVNPLGGCFPVMLQMPLLFALFRVFRSTIELRGAPFVFWIKDLSSPDSIIYLPFTIPVYGDHIAVLPILMGITMFIQQKMMPSQAGSQQKMMSYFMTGFFTLLFNNFPSGLNLYYTLFNLLTILQQKFLSPAITPALPPVKEK